MPGEQYLPPLQSVRKKYCALRSALSRNSSVEVPLKRVAVLVGVGRDLVTPGHPEVEDRDVVAELLAERQDEAAEAAVDVQADAALERELGRAPRSGRSCRSRSCTAEPMIAIVFVVDRARRPPSTSTSVVSGSTGARAQLDAEQVAGLVERGVRRSRA